MIEMHSHLLPGVDDGAPDLETALAMANEYVRQGVLTVICTPHFRSQNLAGSAGKAALTQIQSSFQALKEQLQLDDSPLMIELGLEIELSADLLPALKEFSGYPLTLAGTGYLLIELPRWFNSNLDTLEKLIFGIQIAGYMPILAHPERMMMNEGVLDKLIKWVSNESLLLQVNASSLIEPEGLATEQANRYKRRQTYVKQLIGLELVHFIASDAHNLDSRPPLIQLARQTLHAKYGQELADLLTLDNPARLLANHPIFQPPQQSNMDT